MPGGLVLKHVALMLLLTATVTLAQATVAGDWLLTEDMYGTAFHQRLTLKLDGAVLSGAVGREALEGAVTGNTIRFTIKSEDAADEYTGTIAGDSISGTRIHTEKQEWFNFTRSWSAKRLPARRAGPPQRHEFVPTTFHRQFSASNAPVLHIWPGDTVHTTTVDAGGADEKGVTRVLGGNPETRSEERRVGKE